MKYITIQKAETNWWLSFCSPSTLAVLAYVESLDGMIFYSFYYVMWTDELDIKGEYKGHGFNIMMEWGGDISITFEDDIPEAFANTLIQHFNSYKFVGLTKYKTAVEKFSNLANN